MLSAAALGMSAYGVYSIVEGALDLFRGALMGAPADIGLILLGLLLVVSAAFVRVLVPGGMALALSAMLALQALAIRNTAVLTGDVPLPPQVLRASICAFLLLLGWIGTRDARQHEG